MAAVGIMAAQTIALVSICIKKRGHYKGQQSDWEMIQDASLAMYGQEVYGIAPEKIVNVDGTEMYIIFNPYMMVVCSTNIAMSVPNNNSVIVDADFMKLSEDTQTFIVAHEIGHLKNGHKGKQFKRMFATEDSLRIEYEADEYAMRVVGYDAAVKALKEVTSYVSYMARKEIHKRIRHLGDVK